MPSRTPWRSEDNSIKTIQTKSRRLPTAPPRFAWFVLMATALLANGCAHLNNPWIDSSAVIDSEMTTASAEGHKNRSTHGRQYRRGYSEATVTYENGVTTHWPLWFEDPFEDKGNRYAATEDPDAADTTYAWNWVDYLHIGYGPGRMLLNIAAWPLSAAARHPGMLSESNGRISKGLVWKDHDARPARRADREPPDQAMVRFQPPGTAEP